MVELLRRLLSPEYLVVPQPGPLGAGRALYALLGLFFLLGLSASVWALAGRAAPSRWAGLCGERRTDDSTFSRKPKPDGALLALAWFELWICLAGLTAIAGRFLGWPGWSARVWPLSLTALAGSGALVYLVRAARLPQSITGCLRTLSLAPPTSSAHGKITPVRTAGLLAVAVIHLAGTGLVVRAVYGLPLWVASLILAVLLAPQAALVVRRRPHLAALAPLFAAYGVSLLWLLYRRTDITIVGWQGLAFPNPMGSLFYVDAFCLAAATHSLLCSAAVAHGFGPIYLPRLPWRAAAYGLLALTLSWACIVYLGKRTHGATASDPYAYAQMGVDLADRGTFLHRFALFQQVIPLDIAWAPLQPVGYHIPRNELGDCPSVWATGASVLLAAGYKLLGERGLYLTTPVVALLGLAASWALVRELLHGQPPAVRAVTAALTVALLATSPEFVDRLLVPMADAAAMLFTTLSILFLLRSIRLSGQRGHSVVLSLLLAGLCFGWAYWVRHTQLVLALPILVAGAAFRTAGGPETSCSLGGDGRALNRLRRALPRMGLVFGAALLAALPDIVYRWRVFGGPFATETTELPAMAWQHVPMVALQLLRDTLAAGEWGYLFPLAVYGAYSLVRQRPRQSAVLAAAFGAVLLAHLPYRFLRLRDLISLFPLINIAAAFGAVMVFLRIRKLTRGGVVASGAAAALLPAAATAWLILSPALARWTMIDDLWKPGWASFGYVRAAQRAAFDRLAELTEADAVIAASLNAGAVMMYSARDAVRPYDCWSDEEWRIFLAAMCSAGRPVYLLDDGDTMAEFIEAQRNRYELTPAAELEVPIFARDRKTGWLYRLEYEP